MAPMVDTVGIQALMAVGVENETAQMTNEQHEWKEINKIYKLLAKFRAKLFGRQNFMKNKKSNVNENLIITMWYFWCNLNAATEINLNEY